MLPLGSPSEAQTQSGRDAQATQAKVMLGWRGTLVAWCDPVILFKEGEQNCLSVFDVPIGCVCTYPRGYTCKCVCATRVHGNALRILLCCVFVASSLSAGILSLLVSYCWSRLHLAPRGILASFLQADHSIRLHSSQSPTCLLAPTNSCVSFEDK